jgi:hypothetical protein
MRVRLSIERDGTVLFEDRYDIFDAESFGKACSQAWMQLRERRAQAATSVGALFEELDSQLLQELLESGMKLSKA